MRYEPLPEFVRSNVTREELLDILRPCMSRELFRLIEINFRDGEIDRADPGAGFR